MRTGMIGLAIFLAASPAAQAQFFDAKNLHELCQENQFAAAYYIAGVLDRWSRDLHHAEMSDLVDDENKRPASRLPVTDKIRANVCAPNTVPLRDHLETVCTFVAANPKERERSADMLIQLAMQSAWPCQPK